MKTFYIFVSFLLLTFQFLFAQIPQTISYQGILIDDAGNIVPDGQVNLTFRLYNSSDEGESLWEETQPVEINSGLFNVILGSLNPLDISFDEPYWLGITVGDETEMSPRTPLTSSPYSLGSTATLVEPENGQGLAIRNSESEPTHKFNADGSGMHTGTMVFLKNILVGDSVIDVDTSGLGGPGTATNFDIRSNSNKFFEIQKNDNVPIKARVDNGTAIYGESDYDGVGVKGVSNGSSGKHSAGVLGWTFDKATGVKGTSGLGIGVWGEGPEAGIYAEGKLKVDEVPNAPLQERVLVWDNDNYVKYRTLSEGGGALDCATCEEGSFVIGNTADDHVSIGFPEGRRFAVDVVANEIESLIGGYGVEYGGSGNGANFTLTNPEYNENFIKIGADPTIRNFSMAGLAFSADVSGTSMLGAQFVASPAAAEFYNNATFPTIAAFNVNTDGLSIAANANAQIDGDLAVGGEVSKAGGSFKIDHPLDPLNKYLYHSFVESPQRMNVYNGNIVLDNNGEAVVELPKYFEALNEDFRYQLTCIGGFAQVYIAEKINGNQFKIAGGAPNLEISWQVTGVRKDAYAKSHPLVVEEDKSQIEKGHYLHPEVFGQSKEEGIFYAKNPEAKQKFMEMKAKIPPAKVN